MSAEIARLKRQLAERDEELGHSPKVAATYLREAPEMKYTFIENIRLFSIKAMCRVLLPVAAGVRSASCR